jgi:predicted Zn finger-like uncharacterized protein
MKFVCDNCNAKYQIGDEKVAGKTVRMKCRKCGHDIKVSGQRPGGGEPNVIETTMTGLDVEPAPMSVVGNAIPAPAPSAPAAPAARATWSAEAEDESTSIMNAPVRDAVAAVTAGRTNPAAPAPRPVPAPAPRAVGAAPAPRPAAAPAARPAAAAPAPRPAAPQPHRTRSSSSLPAVRAYDPAIDDVEWYVGIAGSPVGPIRASAIRERAAGGEVDGESLVWREGLPEWKPLKTFPELLAAIVPAAPAPAPTPEPALITPQPPKPAAPAPAPAPAPVAAAPAPVAPAPPAPIAAAPAPAPAAAAPVAPAPAPAPAPVAAAPAPAPAPAAPAPSAAPIGILGDPFAAPPSAAPSPTSQQNGKANGTHAGALAFDGLAAAANAPAAPVEPVRPDVPKVDIDPGLEERLVPRPRQTSPAVYAFIAAAAVFGGVAAWALLINKPQPQIVVVQAPPIITTVAPSSSASSAPDGQTQVEVGDISTDKTATPNNRQASAGGGPKPKPSGSSASTAPLDTSGFVNNVPGPQATAPSGPGPGGGGQLSQGEIQGVVASQQPMVKRKCWQPALEARAANGPTNARVSASITIGPSGNVESASASGSEKDFPGLSSCIAARMKNWKFPPSGGTTTANVPFVFAGQ